MSENLRRPSIEARGLSVAYNDQVCALENVDFRAFPGEFIALLGPNGSGKTTLIKALAGLLKPRAGMVRVFGREVSAWSTSELYQHVGIVFQNPEDQLFSATVEEDVAFGPRNLGLTEPEVAARTIESLRSVGALSLRSREIPRLSFGEKKRVAIAGVLAMRPKALLLDEPTAGLDPIGERQMLELLGRLSRQDGVTIIMATHCVDLLPVFAQRVCVLKRGRVAGAGTPAAIFADPRSIHEAELRLPYVLANSIRFRDLA